MTDDYFKHLNISAEEIVFNKTKLTTVPFSCSTTLMRYEKQMSPFIKLSCGLQVFSVSMPQVKLCNGE